MTGRAQIKVQDKENKFSMLFYDAGEEYGLSIAMTPEIRGKSAVGKSVSGRIYITEDDCRLFELLFKNAREFMAARKVYLSAAQRLMLDTGKPNGGIP